MFVLIILEVANRTYYANAKWLCTVAKKFCYGMYNVYPMYLCTAFKRRQGDVRSPLRSAVFPEGSMKNLMKAVAGHLPIPLAVQKWTGTGATVLKPVRALIESTDYIVIIQ